jgi:hypothetical protein
LDNLFHALSLPHDEGRKPEISEAIIAVRTLCNRQFVLSAAFLFAQWRDLLSTQSLETILPLAPNAASFEIWRKASAVPTKELEQQLLTSFTATYATAAADWLLLRIPPEKQLSLLELFLTRQPRPQYLPAWSESLTLALKRDKRGVLLHIVLRTHALAEDCVAALAEVIHADPSLMKVAIDALPEILTAKEPPVSVMALVRQLFGNLVTTTDADRQIGTALLARFGTGILLHREIGPCATEALEFVRLTASQLRGATRADDLRLRTWVFENLAEAMSADGGVHVTLEGARRLATAFEKVERGFAAKDILTVTALNLGLVSMETPGQVVAYDPLRHEDTIGGMLPKATALVLESGWLYGTEVVMRARVKSKEAPHV